MQKLILGAVVVLACVCLIQAAHHTAVTNSTATVNGQMETASTNTTMMATSVMSNVPKVTTAEVPTSGAVTVKAVAGFLAPIFLFAWL